MKPQMSSGLILRRPQIPFFGWDKRRLEKVLSRLTIILTFLQRVCIACLSFKGPRKVVHRFISIPHPEADVELLPQHATLAALWLLGSGMPLVSPQGHGKGRGMREKGERTRLSLPPHLWQPPQLYPSPNLQPRFPKAPDPSSSRS